MKKVITLLLSVIISFVLTAQQEVDSLRQLLSVAKTDTAAINLMNKIAVEFGESSPDSIFQYATEARRLSQKFNYEYGEISAILNLSWAFTVTGNYSKGLEYALDGLKRSEKTGDQELIVTSLWAIAGAYSFQDDNKQTLVYALKILDLYKDRPMDARLARALGNVGVTYFNLNNHDSGRYYFDRSMDIAMQVNDQGTLAGGQMNTGRIFLKQGQYDTAIMYFRKAMPIFVKDNNLLFIYSNSYFLAEAFDSTRQYDSAMYYSKLAMHHVNAMNSSAYLSEIAKQLSFLYRQTGHPDSAWFFMNMAMTAKDSVSSQENQKKIQNLTFTEQLRQNEIAEQQKKDAETRKKNLQLSGIAIFIPLFLLAVMLIGRRKIKSRTIEFLGILGLLFLFEFIVLLIHPYIGHWAHESPVWMLLILVAIAAILVPLHHRSEGWMKKMLSKIER